MATALQVPIDEFLRRVEADRSFFSYFNVSEESAMEIALCRACVYLHEAVAVFTLNCAPDVTIFAIDENHQQFGGDLTFREIYILGSLMFEMYMTRDIAKLKTMNVNFTATDLRVFDPSNARNSFMEMYNAVKAENRSMMDTYRNTDRLTGQFHGIDFGSYEE